MRHMLILGLETSCDETAAAIVENGSRVLSNVVASQIDIHKEYGGVVPEVAARSHIEVVLPVIHEALETAGVTWDDIDGIAVTQGPGLLGSLLIGTLTARTIALIRHKPLYAVNHVVAHTFANFLIEPQPQFPLLALSVSGGHSHMLLFESPLEYRLLGRTRDDAAGEAFDKVAKMMGLPYPGGPIIDKTAPLGDPHAYKLPKAKLGDSLDFSFSGLKTAVLRTLQSEIGGDFRTHSSEIPGRLTETQINDMCASFQLTIYDTLAAQLYRAYQQHQPKSVVIAGGVAASRRLRQIISEKIPLEMHYAPMQYCTDNGAMIAAMGYHLAQAGRTTDPLEFKTDPSLAI
ncbi:MAG: tRNA N6-adenosine threonylcarbamoyltransferase [Patescibacteria group bacterium]|nr:tRNA N6-adenosine threonylcarbamoyltransferase [Patescibacteria group bacterium]